MRWQAERSVPLDVHSILNPNSTTVLRLADAAVEIEYAIRV